MNLIRYRESPWTILGNNLHVDGLIILVGPTSFGAFVESTIPCVEVHQ